MGRTLEEVLYTYAALILSAAAGLGAYTWIDWADLNAGDWGTWIGAIGTVTTLAGTIWIATTERRNRVRGEVELARVTLSGMSFRLNDADNAMRAVSRGLAKDYPAYQHLDYDHSANSLKRALAFETRELVALSVLHNNVASKLAATLDKVRYIQGLLQGAATNPKLRTHEARMAFNREQREILIHARRDLRAAYVSGAIELQVLIVRSNFVPALFVYRGPVVMGNVSAVGANPQA